MNKHTSHTHDTHSLVEDARELLSATVDVAGEKVSEARQRVTAALEKIKNSAQATDKAVHQHPYKAITIAAGAGLILGYIFAHRCSQKSESKN